MTLYSYIASSPTLKVTEDLQQISAGEHWGYKVLAACVVKASFHQSEHHIHASSE